MFRQPYFIYHLFFLWTTFAVLVVITAGALTTAYNRSDCLSNTATTSATSITIGNYGCTHKEHISAIVGNHLSYFQAIHATTIRVLVIFSLQVLTPSLWAMTWASLESPHLPDIRGVQKLNIGALQSGIKMITSASLLHALNYVKMSRSIKPQVIFIILVSIASLLTSFLVSPIYRHHSSPYPINANIAVGGGIGPTISPSLNLNDLVAGGTAAGRALANAATVSNVSVTLPTFDISVATFIPWSTIKAIWYTQVIAVSARNVLDCGPSAPERLSTTAQNLVTISDSYFGINQEQTFTQPTFAGQACGYLRNDPTISVVYLNQTNTHAPGIVQGQTSVIFLAANGTMEGAQHTLVSPHPTARITSIDVLVCTSTTTLEISQCTIKNRNLTNCESASSSDLPIDASTSPTGGVEHYVTNPISVVAILAASAVTNYYSLGTRLPMYDPEPWVISAGLPPLSFLTGNTYLDNYTISLDYVRDVLFGQTAQYLVQGINTKGTTMNTTAQVSIIAMFGTSQPLLAIVIAALGLVCAATATWAGMVPHSAREAVALDAARLLAISRNEALDKTFVKYADRSIEMGKEVGSAGVKYEWVDELGRPALVVETESPEAAPNDKIELVRLL